MTIVVIAEIENDELTLASLECVEEARGVADVLERTVATVLLGENVAHLADDLISHDTDSVLAVEQTLLGNFSSDGWLQALEATLTSANFSLLLTPNSAHSRAWLPRFALRQQIPLVTGCTQVRVMPDGQLELTRPVYGGLQREMLHWDAASPLLVTFVAGMRGLEANIASGENQAVVQKETSVLDETQLRDQTVAQHPPDTKIVDVSEAERIVAGGLGIGTAEAVNVLWQLAEPLGATVAGTRVISDRHWIPHERYIGSTGKTVAPKLYIALGISGASQHTVGMSDSDTIIAINIDRTAPIFGLADLGIVGDLHEIVPKLIERLNGNI